MEMFDDWTWLRGVVVAVVALGVVAILLNKERDVHRAVWVRTIGVLSVLVAALLLALVGWRVIAPPPAFAQADVALGAAPFVSPAVPPGSWQLRVQGALDAAGASQSEGRYAVRVLAGGVERATFSGTLSKKTQTQKFMRRGRMSTNSAHLEGRHELPADLASAPLSFEVTRADGKIVGPLHLEVVQAPLSARTMLILGVLLAFIGGLVDKSTKAARTWIGLGIAMLCALAILLLEAPHPLTTSHLLRSVPVAGMAGGVVGAVLRVIARMLLRTKKAAVRPSSVA